MSSKLFIGSSGWNYLDTSQNGGWWFILFIGSYWNYFK